MSKYVKVLSLLCVLLLSPSVSVTAATASSSAQSTSSSGTAALPPAIAASITTGVTNYIQTHLPPDPTVIFSSVPCGSGDSFCNQNEQAWQSFQTQYDAAQAMQNVNYGNQSTSATQVGTDAGGNTSNPYQGMFP